MERFGVSNHGFSVSTASQSAWVLLGYKHMLYIGLLYGCHIDLIAACVVGYYTSVSLKNIHEGSSFDDSQIFKLETIYFQTVLEQPQKLASRETDRNKKNTTGRLGLHRVWQKLDT
jgi:hypothetical protein